jgi:hypothetical protein
MNRTTCNTIIERGLGVAIDALSAGNQGALRLAIWGMHVAVQENLLAELEEQIVDDDLLGGGRRGLPLVSGARVERSTRAMEASRLIEQAGEVMA